MSSSLSPQKSTPSKSAEFDRVILITGAAGFIASNLTNRLVNKYPNYHIIAYDSLTYCGFTANLKEVWDRPNFTFIEGDILSDDLVSHVIKTQHVDTIFHAAAESHVDLSFGNSLLFTKTNVLGTNTMLECALKFKSQIRLFLHVSTDEVYSGKHNHACTESETVLSPTNFYSASKAAAEHLVRAAHTSFGLPIVISRGNNVVGPRQFPEKLIPKFINLMHRGSPCPIHGNGESRRSFLYVDDVAAAFDILIHKGEIGETYNVGSEKEFTVLETFDRLADLMGLTQEQKQKSCSHVRDRHFNDQRYFIDCEKMRALGWEATTDFDSSLRKTIDWYLAPENLNHFGDIEESLVAHPGQPHGHHDVDEDDAAAAVVVVDAAMK